MLHRKKTRKGRPMSIAVVIFLIFFVDGSSSQGVVPTPTTTTFKGSSMQLFGKSHSAYTLLHGNNLVGLYEFTFGDARDTSPAGLTASAGQSNPLAYGHDGVMSSGIMPVTAGYAGKALYFKGMDHVRFEIDINPAAMAQVSMGGWVKTASLNTGTGAAGYDMARHLFTHDDGGQGFDRGVGIDNRGGTVGWVAYRGLAGNGVLGHLPVVLNTWQFVAVVYDAGAKTVLLYVDGDTLVGTADCSAGSTFLNLGKSPMENVGLHGTVDSAFVYNTALTVDELEHLRTFSQDKMAPVAGSGGYAVMLNGAARMEAPPSVPRRLALAPKSPDGLDALTISMWIKSNKIQDAGVMGLVEKASASTKEYSVELYHEPNKDTADVRLRLGDRVANRWSFVWNSYQSISVDGSWTHLTVVWDSRAAQPFVATVINGVPHVHNFTGTRLPVSDAPLVFGVSTKDGHDTTSQYFDGALDEIQVWHIARSLQKDLVGVRAYHRRLSGQEEGLVGYWSMDEGHGSVAASSVFHDNALFGALTVFPRAGEPPAWIASTAQVGGIVETLEDVPVLIRLNGTDAAGRAIVPVLTSLPALGKLFVGPPAFEQGNQMYTKGSQVTSVPHQLGEHSFILYEPPVDGFSGSVDIRGKASDVFATFTYYVSTVDEDVVDAIPTEVRIFVDPVNDMPQFLSPSLVSLEFKDYRIDDIDAWEGKGALDVSVRVDSENAPLGNILHRERPTVTLGSTLALDFASPDGQGDGIRDPMTRFTGSLDRVNTAVETIIVRTPPTFDGNFSMAVDDLGDQGLGGALKDSHTVGLHLRTGSIPSLMSVVPPSAPVRGGLEAKIVGSNFDVDQLQCVWAGHVSVAARKLSSTELRCTIPPMSAGLVSLQIVTGVGFASNKLQFTYEEEPVVAKINPSSGPLVGGSRVVISGGAIVSSPFLACRFGSVIVQASYISHSAMECTAPKVPAAGPVSFRISNNGYHFSRSDNIFTYFAPVVVNSLVPSVGPSTGKTVIMVRGLNFVNSTGISCKFGKSIVQATFLSQTLCSCVSPPVAARVSLPFATSFSMSINGIDFASNTRVFSYLSHVEVKTISPKHGPVEGGSTISVYGVHFVDSDALVCRFGAETVPAKFITSEHIQCVSPRRSTGSVALEVSTNKVDFTTNEILYEYKVQSLLILVEPSLGPVAGGTDVTLTGTGFARGNHFQCRFGNSNAELVPAERIASTLIRCKSPKIHKPGTKAVQVTSNGIDFTEPNPNVVFTYHDNIAWNIFLAFSGGK
eukprot:Stramenopile-MAST_4_protein_3958